MFSDPYRMTRRGFLRASIALTAPIALACSTGPGLSLNTADARAQNLQLTPECIDADDLTPAQTEGPYFTRSSPERASLLEPGMPGTRLTVSGAVLSSACQPIGGALLDFWQADDRGQYDNVSYQLRGHQFTDAEGQFTLETIMPGLYPGRTRHIHVKAQAPGGRLLTTQLYFAGEPGNARDGIYRPELEVSLYDGEAGDKSGRFNFVVATA